MMLLFRDCALCMVEGRLLKMGRKKMKEEKTKEQM